MEDGLLETDSAAVTLGGGSDVGGGMEPALVEEVAGRLKGMGLPLMAMAGKDPEKPAPTVSPGRTPASWSSRTQRAPISGQAVVRLASSAPRVVVIPV